nr:MOSC domain-containing protein [Hoeflea prorocentri]
MSLFTGKPKDRWPGRPPSAILKHSAEGPLSLGKTGLEGDQQADLSVHGGPERAVHHYASEHMAFWCETYADTDFQFVPGCFGENISTSGVHEENLCLGDVLTMGTAKVQVCQGRQPCWKLNEHTGIASMAARFQKSARTGWYYRIIETGMVEAGDEMALIERKHPEWTLNRLITARFDPKLAVEEANELAALPALSSSWREAFEKKSAKGFTENTEARLSGT